MSGAASEPGLIRKEQYSPAEIDHLFTFFVLRLILAMAYPYTERLNLISIYRTV